LCLVTMDTTLSRGQFFAILRLILHIRGGAELDRSLVFKNSPGKWQDMNHYYSANLMFLLLFSPFYPMV